MSIFRIIVLKNKIRKYNTQTNPLKTWDWVILKQVFIKLTFPENGSNDTEIVQYFIMYGLGLCIKLNIFVSHMFYTWSFSNNSALSIASNQKNNLFN